MTMMGDVVVFPGMSNSQALETRRRVKARVARPRKARPKRDETLADVFARDNKPRQTACPGSYPILRVLEAAFIYRMIVKDGKTASRLFDVAAVAVKNQSLFVSLPADLMQCVIDILDLTVRVNFERYQQFVLLSYNLA